MAELVLRLLGPPEICAGDTLLRFARRQPLALLAFLALSPAPVPREQLMLLLFGDQPRRVGRERLRRVLHELRRALAGHDVDAGLLQAGGDVVWLDRARCDIDVLCFEAAARAEVVPSEAQLQAYRGPLLHGFTLEAAAEWELWLAGERERLEQARLDLLARLAEQATALGGWEAAAAHAQALLAADALHEAAHVYLMEAYAAQGKLGAVRRQYQTLCTVLRVELGCEPSPVAQQRFGELVHRQRRDRAAPPRTRRAVDAFWGREAQLRSLETAFTLASAEQQLACVLGPSGIGKTRLLDEALRRFACTGGVGVLRATCSPALQHAPYAALAEAFTAAMPAEHNPFTTGALRAQDALADAAERRVWEVLATALLSFGRRHEQLVLVLDDLQWADEPLLRALPYVLRRLASLPVLVLLACRSEDQPAAVATTLRSLCVAATTTVLELQPLDQQAVSVIVRDWAGGDAPRLAGALLHETEGNPFLLVETLRSLDEQGRLRPDMLPEALPLPRAVQAAVRERIERLPPAVRLVAETAALMGRELRLEPLRRAAGSSEAGFADALDRLIHAGFVRQHAGGVGFAHGKLQEALVGQLSPARRGLLHRRIAHALAKRSEPGTAALLLAHAREAGEWELAYGAARRAALEARRLASFEAAAMFEQAALSALDRLPDDERRATTLLAVENDNHVLGRRAAQEAGLRQLEALAVGAGITAEVLHRRGRLYDAVGRAAEARPLLEQALRDTADAELRATVQLALARCLLHLGDDGAQALAYEALSEASGPGTAARRSNALLMLADIAYYRDDIAAMQRWLHEAHVVARFGADAQARLRVMLARALFRSGDYVAALREAKEAYGAYAALGDLQEQAYCRLVQGAANGRLHRFVEASACYGDALRAFRALGHLRGEAGATLNLALQRTRVADYAAAGPLIETAYGLFERAGDPHGRCLAALNLSHHNTMLGRASAAEQWARIAIELAEQRDVPVHRSTAVANLAGALAVGGRYADARELYTQILYQGARDDLFTARALSTAWLACTCVALGDLEAACEHSAAAVTMAEAMPGAADHPQTVYAARAFVLRHAGDELGARAALARAAAALERLLSGMSSAADRRCYEQHLATNRFIRAAQRGDWASQHPLF